MRQIHFKNPKSMFLSCFLGIIIIITQYPNGIIDLGILNFFFFKTNNLNGLRLFMGILLFFCVTSGYQFKSENGSQSVLIHPLLWLLIWSLVLFYGILQLYVGKYYSNLKFAYYLVTRYNREISDGKIILGIEIIFNVLFAFYSNLIELSKKSQFRTFFQNYDYSVPIQKDAILEKERKKWRDRKIIRGFEIFGQSTLILGIFALVFISNRAFTGLIGGSIIMFFVVVLGILIIRISQGLYRKMKQ